MKNLLQVFCGFALVMLLVGTAEAGQRQYFLQCKVTRVYDHGVFEEGLSVGEYPDVNFGINPKGMQELGIGSSSFTADKEYSLIVATNNQGQVEIHALHNNYDLKYSLIVDRGLALRKMWVKAEDRTDGKSKKVTVAVGLCMSNPDGWTP